MGIFKETQIEYNIFEWTSELPSLWELQVFDEACKFSELDERILEFLIDSDGEDRQLSRRAVQGFDRIKSSKESQF